MNVARSPASSVTVVARLPVPEAAAQLDPGSAAQVQVGATRATGNRSVTLAAVTGLGPSVGHHDRVGRGPSRASRCPVRVLVIGQVGDRLRGQGHARRVVGRVGIRLIAGRDARRVGDRARLRDARGDRQPRAAGRSRSIRPSRRPSPGRTSRATGPPTRTRARPTTPP